LTSTIVEVLPFVDMTASSNNDVDNSVIVTHLDDLPEGSMKMVKVDGHRVCVVRTSTGVHALDHACPHEGYGLTQGNLDDDLLTCAWHNWKFRVTDGACVLGEEAVQVHEADVDDAGSVRVRLNRPDPEVRRAQYLDSLQRGIERNYIGQVSRDVVRLLRAGASPADLITTAVLYGAPRAEYGWGHPIAAAADCLAMVDLFEGDERSLPIVQGISGIAESERHRPVRELAEPVACGATIDNFRAAVERESVSDAQSLLRGAIARGDGPDQVRPWFTAVVSDHHLGYGHPAIYSQKAFELLEMIGWDHADTVLAHLVPSVVYSTREDTLPYMKPFMMAMGSLDLGELAAIVPDPAWSDDGMLRAALLGADRTEPVAAVVRALREGAGIDGVLDAVVDATSERMLRYDTDGEFDLSDDFGWLDITHGLTYAHAVRSHATHADEVSPDLIRLTLFSAFQAHWTGRHEWHSAVLSPSSVDPLSPDVARYGDDLQRLALLDGTTAPIVHEHAVKTSRAAALEAARRGTSLPLDAVARFVSAPKLERFVAASVQRSIDFIAGRIDR
jgi:nitrite reductase/ring-hydroxylating ferredoxin subunit